MASNPKPPKAKNLSGLRMVWGFASRYRLQLVAAAIALLFAAGATSGVPYAFKLIIDAALCPYGQTGDIARGSNICGALL